MSMEVQRRAKSEYVMKIGSLETGRLDKTRRRRSSGCLKELDEMLRENFAI